jgi:hypothetical protein
MTWICHVNPHSRADPPNSEFSITQILLVYYYCQDPTSIRDEEVLKDGKKTHCTKS